MATSHRLVATCLSKYKRDKTHIRRWLDSVERVLRKRMRDPQSRIHSLRTRMKNNKHLEDKLKKRLKIQRVRDFYRKNNDLAGARILVLYRNDIPIVDYLLGREKTWRLKKRVAYYDRNRPNDRKWFQLRGFPTKPKPHGYTSVHYSLVPRKLRSPDWKVCEVQLRTIHQEAWGEFDHQIKYPSGEPDELAAALIERLSGLLQIAEDIVGDIRKSPAYARIFEILFSAVSQNGGFEMESCIGKLNALLKTQGFLYRISPFAALGLLAKREGDCPAPSRRIVSLDFGGRKDQWTATPLKRFYLDARSEEH